MNLHGNIWVLLNKCSVSVQNGPIQNSPIQNSPEKYDNERTKTVRYKTVTSNNCFNKPAGREVSFVQQTKNKIVNAAVAPACCELANRG